MQNILFKTLFVAASATVLVSCKPDLKAPEPDKGSADVTKYVAIGNSITAGYADGALYYKGQTFSYANLLAEQFKLVGGGEFTTPFFPESSVGAGSTGNAPFVLGYKTDCKGVSALSPVPATANGAGDVNTLFYTSVASQGPFNNMGVPGAKVITTVYGNYGNASLGFNPTTGKPNYNPFFARMIAPSEYTTSILAKASSQGHTFFTCFLGNNDVLGNATSGGLNTVSGGDDITPIANFSGAYDMIVNAMTTNGQKGALATVPDITSLPYFTTVPSRGLVLTAAQAAQLNVPYAAYGISFSAGPNGFIIEDATAPGGLRKATANDYILLNVPSDSLKCYGMGTGYPIPTAPGFKFYPIPDKYVLTAKEATDIRDAVSAYNSKIKAICDAKGLAFVDANAFMAKAKSGIAYNGMTVSATFVSGGAFSLDGVHLTPRGNAMLANEFIKAINSTYGAKIPEVNVTKYDGVKFP